MSRKQSAVTRSEVSTLQTPRLIALVRNLILIALGLFLLPGCYAFTSSNDVSQDSRYYLGFAPGQVYRLRSAGSVIRYTGSGNVCFLESQQFIDGPHNRDFPKFETIEVLPADSHVRVERLMHTITRAPIQGESYVEVFVTSMDHSLQCETLRMGNSMYASKMFVAPNTWPTMVPLPSALNLVLEEESAVKKD